MSNGVLRGFQFVAQILCGSKKHTYTTHVNPVSVSSVVLFPLGAPILPFFPLPSSLCLPLFSETETHPTSYFLLNNQCRWYFAFQRFSSVFILSSAPSLIHALGSVTVVVGLQTPQISFSLKSPVIAMWLCVLAGGDTWAAALVGEGDDNGV